MANYGGFGDPSALAMQWQGGKREQRQDAALAACGLAKDAWQDEFVVLCPETLKLHEAGFVAHVRRQGWGIDGTTARAAFKACDVDGSGFLNAHEYALLRAALTNCEGGPLDELRLRTVFHKYASTAMNAAERRLLVRDLASADTHVDALVKKLDWPDDDRKGCMSLEAFLSAMPRLKRAELYPDVVHTTTPSRCVLDPRCVVASSDALKSAAVGSSFVNEGLVLDENLRVPHGGDWRGALAAPRGNGSYAVAEAVIEKARHLARAVIDEEDVSDANWDCSLLPTEAGIIELADDVQRVLSAEPTVARCRAPAKIFGDIHGQFRDLLLLLGHHGFPSHRGGDVETVSYVFNGDWTDRGAHQLEVVVFLFALKVMYPSRIVLVRGNHEFRRQNESMGDFGFCAHCERRGLTKAYSRIHEAFDMLPLGCLVHDTIFVVHGGIGDGSWTIDDLDKVTRPLADSGAQACVRHALWSDPTDSDADMARGVHYPSKGESGYRGSGIAKFGPDVTARFCAKNEVALIVRSHQFVRAGVKIMHSGHLATLFSARNYFDRNSNDAALLLVCYDDQGALRVRAKRLAHLCTHLLK